MTYPGNISNVDLSGMKIALIDDHDLVREGLNSILSRNGVICADNFSNASDFLNRLAQMTYDFYIVDLELPDLDGFTVIERIREIHPSAKIIVCTIHDEIWTLRRLLTLDVDGILFKSGKADNVIHALNEIIEGHRYYSDEVTRALSILDKGIDYPSQREMDVLQEISLGRTTKEIARKLFISVNTVEAHRKSLFIKLNAGNVADLILKAVKLGYIKKNSQF